MWKSVGIASALFSACGLVLSACGGGGGDEASGFAFRAADVTGGSAILATGGSPPDFSSAQAISEQREIMYRANVGHRTRIEVDSDGYDYRSGPWSYDVDCNPDTCKVFYGGEVVNPIMTKNGVRLARISWTGSDEDYEGNRTNVVGLEYGGWMNHSRFQVDVRTETYGGGSSVIGVEGWGQTWGAAPQTNPNVGPFVWNGVMAGRNSDIASSAVSNVVQGDAAVTAELSQAGDMSVDVTFSNIVDVNAGSSMVDITWTDLPVVDGTFESSTILGSFFGPRHEEVAGVFEKDYVLGAFGAHR